MHAAGEWQACMHHPEQDPNAHACALPAALMGLPPGLDEVSTPPRKDIGHLSAVLAVVP